jgi:hypothetical protein
VPPGQPKGRSDDGDKRGGSKKGGKGKKGHEDASHPGAASDEDVNVFVSVRHLSKYRSPWEMESLGMEALKEDLMGFGLKAGGTLEERAERLFALKDLKGNIARLGGAYFVKGVEGKKATIAGVGGGGGDAWAGAGAGAGGGGGGGGGVGWGRGGGAKTVMGGEGSIARSAVAGAADEKTGKTGAGAGAGKTGSGGGRPPLQMHKICTRFAENLADAAAPHGGAVQVECSLPVA